MMENVAIFPFERTVERVPNNPRHEMMFDILTGLPPARQKRLILRARDTRVGFITDGDADVLMSALGLGES